MTLDECLREAARENETLQIGAVEYLAARHRHAAARGIFEPDFVLSAGHDVSLRKTTAQQRQQLVLPALQEENNTYGANLEMLAPTGAKVRLGYSLRDLRNNIQALQNSGREFESFAGLSLTQPLLRNAWSSATLAGIRLAASESELAFQEYRRQAMTMLARAEAAYWDLCFAQEQHRLAAESLRVAQSVLRDNQVRQEAGKGAELEVLRGEAGVALRKSRLSEAQQKVNEAMNRLVLQLGGSAALARTGVRATDPPRLAEVTLDFAEAMAEGVANNPEYLGRLHQVTQERIRVTYARNQRWPQLDLKAAYGVNGLARTPDDSLAELGSNQFETWSVGLELRLPLFGGSKPRHELAAARLRQEAALMALKAAETALATTLDTAIARLAGARESATNYERVGQFTQQLLETETARLEAGKGDTRRVLEVEESLFQSRVATLEAVVAHAKGRVDWALARGTYLRDHRLDCAKEELAARLDHARPAGSPSAGYGLLRRQAAEEFDRRASPTAP